MKNTKPTPRFSRLRLGLVLAGFIVLIAGGAWAALQSNKSATPLATPMPSTINEKTDTEQAHRQATPSPVASVSPAPTASGTPAATPAVTAAPNLKPTIIGVSGHDNAATLSVVVDALPDTATSGTCRATLTQGATVRTVTSPVTIVTSYYACTSLRFDKAQLTSGDWSLVVSVDSPAGTGSSDPQTVTVKK